MSHPLRLRILGAVVVVAFFVACAAGVAAYRGDFDAAITVSIRADRSGLLLEPGSDIALRGADIGRVISVDQDGDGAQVTAAIDDDRTEFVTPDAVARIESPTLLGPKFVDLSIPERSSGGSIADGAVLFTETNQIEVNAAFDNLIGLLQSIQPSKVDAALGALSTTLNGRGALIGEYVTEVNAYLKVLNGSLPQLQNDLRLLSPTAQTYADITPELARVLDNLSVTGATLRERDPQLDAFLLSLRGLSDNARGFLADNEEGLVTALDTLRPTTELAARYSPMFPCLFATLNQYRRSVEPASGGIYPGLYTRTTVIPGKPGYESPQDLPEVSADAPGCAGGPVGGDYDRVEFDDGSPELDTAENPETTVQPSLALQLFGRELPLLTPETLPTGGGR